MGTLAEDIQTGSAWIAKALSGSGYQADFTPASLWEIDRFFDEHSTNGQPVRGGLLSKDVGSRLFAIGSYVGEVIRRHQGGEWIGDDADPEGEINVELRLADSSQCWPVQRAMKRYQNGSEDSIAAYGLALGLPVGPKPEPKAKKPWWKIR